MVIVFTLIVYFLCLLAISRLTVRRGGNADFFRAGRRSPWPMVAFGMIGASISGITFVSVPGMAINLGMTYLQMCMGFIVGYAVVAFVLLPLYYKLNLTTIYTYLEQRFGRRSYLTGSGFFLIGKMTGSAVKFYVVCMILQRFALDQIGVPMPVTAAVLVLFIWLYTRRGGIRTLVWTDCFQTLCIILAVVLIIVRTMDALEFNLNEAVSAICSSGHARVFVFDDWVSTQNFWKQFLSGVFIVVVMTGLDQDMMQKNLTCRTLREAQKDMCSYGVAFLPVNLLFLSLGVLLILLSQKEGLPLPAKTDELMLTFAAGGKLGTTVTVLFTIGIVAACFSTADSSLTSMTTSFCIDICRQPDNERLRKRVHAMMAVVFVAFIILFGTVNSTSLIDAIYTLVSYTYGPLLGLFAYGLLTHRTVCDRAVPYVAVASPLLCLAISWAARKYCNYTFGYELLMMNALITIAGLIITSKWNQHK